MVGEARGTEGQLRGEGGAISASRLNNALIVKLQSESGGRGEVDAQIISRTCLKVCTCTCTCMYCYKIPIHVHAFNIRNSVISS